MDYQTQRQRSKQGKEGEDLFQKWLQNFDAPFLRVDNDTETYAQLFKGKLKRPDFLLLITGMGLLAVDVKNLTPVKKEEGGFFLDFEEELNYSVEFEHAFKIFLWYAIRDKSAESDNKWHFISAYDALQNGEIKTRENNTHYYHIAGKYFTVIENANDVPELLKDRRGVTGFLTSMLESAILSTKLK